MTAYPPRSSPAASFSGLHHQFSNMNLNGGGSNAFRAKGGYNDIDPIDVRSLDGSPASRMFGGKRIMAPVRFEGYIFHRPKVIPGQQISWRKAKKASMPCSQKELEETVRQAQDGGLQVMTLFNKLSENKQLLLNDLLEKKRHEEHDPRAEWCIAAIKEHTAKQRTKKGFIVMEDVVTKSIQVIFERKLDTSHTPAGSYDGPFDASGLRATSFSTPPMPGGPFHGRTAAVAGGPPNHGDFGPHAAPFRGQPAFNPGGMNGGASAAFGPLGRDPHGNAFGVGGGGGGIGPNMQTNGMPPAGPSPFMGGARPGMPGAPMQQMPPNGPGPFGPSMQQMPPNGPVPFGPSTQHGPGAPPLRPQMPPMQPNMQVPPPMHGGPMPPSHPIGVPPHMPSMPQQPLRPQPMYPMPGQQNGPPPMHMNANRQPPFMPPPGNQYGVNGIGRKPVGEPAFQRHAPNLDAHGVLQFDGDDDDDEGSGRFTPVFSSDGESDRTGNTSLGSADFGGRSKKPHAARGAYPVRDEGGVHAGRRMASGDARRYSDRSARRFGRDNGAHRDGFEDGRHRRRSSAAESEPRFDSAFRRSHGRSARYPSSDDEQLLSDSLDEENERVNGPHRYDARHKTRTSGDGRSRTVRVDDDSGARWRQNNAARRHAEDDGYYGSQTRGRGYNARRG